MGTFSRRLGAAAFAATVALFTAAPAYAVHNDGVFQIDGDAQKGPSLTSCGGNPSGTGPSAFGGIVGCTGDDWNALYSCPTTGTLGQCTKATPGVGNSAAAIADLVTDLSPLSIFTTGGSKDEQDITQWRWTNGSVPDKDDLIQAFGALYTPASGKTLYFGANRLAVNGDAQIGFWFLQNATFLCGDPAVTGACTPGTFVGRDGKPVSHKLGDILILSNFVNGGGSSNIQVFKVVQITPGTCPAGSVETSAGSGDICVQQIVNGTAGANGVCNGVTGSIPADAACAATNGSAVAALDPRFVPKTGAPGTYPIVGFFEGGLDLAVIPGLGDECFPSFMVETRSSQSITAVLKDFTLGKFENCSSGVKTEIHLASNPTGADIQCQTGVTCTAIHSTDTIFDKAIVTGTLGAPAPSGTVTFTYYTNGTCTAPGTTETVNLNTGTLDSTTNSVIVSSGNHTPSPTAVSFSASYSGDGRYPPGEDGCEFITVKAQPGISTTPSPSSATVGATLKDTASLTGGSSPTGTITFNLYPPSDATCSGTASDTEQATVNGNGSYSTPTGFVSNAVGTWHWTASYSGDAGNESASSACADEPVTVGPASPSLVTTPSAGGVIGVTLNDSGTLSGGYNPTGSITFNLWDPTQATCAGTPAYTQTVTVSGNGTYNTSPGFLSNLAGTWNWTASYSGDANNNTASSGCGAESVTVTKASPSATTAPTLTVINNDSATLSGGASPTGTLTFKLFQGTIASPPSCGAGTEIASFPVAVNAGNAKYSTSNATPITVNADAVFRWTVTYSGDGNNNSFTNACVTGTLEQVSIDITP